MAWVTEQGETLLPGARIAAAGGEGTVYEIPRQPALVAKIYHRPVEARRARKLQRMIRMAGGELSTIAAWPQALLRLGPDGPVAGFLMARIDGQEIHRLCSPADRRHHFPGARWSDLIRVAREVAVAFETLHGCGIVMGDVNEKNLLVSGAGQVRLIDCDSYQVPGEGEGEVFTCDVGVPLWTAPELQGRPFRGLPRTPNHDRFGLALLIFELLFMGRHPFAGVREGAEGGGIEEAIREFRFAFGRRDRDPGWAPPPHTLGLEALPEPLAGRFEQAFSREAERSGGRPSGREWVEALDLLLERQAECRADAGHTYWRDLAHCPWCRILGGGGPNFFVSVVIHRQGVTDADVEKVRAVIDRVLAASREPGAEGGPEGVAREGRAMPLECPVPPVTRLPEHPGPPWIVPEPELPPGPGIPGKATPAVPDRVARVPMSWREVRWWVGGWGWGGLVAAAVACLAAGFPWVTLTLVGAAVFAGVLGADCRDRAGRESRARRTRHAEAVLAAAAAAEEARQRTVREREREQAPRRQAQEAGLREMREAHARQQAACDAEYARALARHESQVRAHREALARYEEARNRWDAECRMRQEAVVQTRADLEAARARLGERRCGFREAAKEIGAGAGAWFERYARVQAEEGEALGRLEAVKSRLQFREFLDSRLIQEASIPGIGPATREILRAYGVESALALHEGLSVPGVPDSRMRRLLEWRRRCEAEFRPDPRSPLAESDQRLVRAEHEARRREVFAGLKSLAERLEVLETEADRSVADLEAAVARAADAHAQAMADGEVAAREAGLLRSAEPGPREPFGGGTPHEAPSGTGRPGTGPG